MSFGTRLQQLRKDMNMTQKEFAELLEIPQPSVSAYENNKNTPTMDILVTIANRCNVSLDWLCEVSYNKQRITSMDDVIDVLFELFETNEFGFDVEIHRRAEQDTETENDRAYARLTVFATDPYSDNETLCDVIWKVHDIYEKHLNYFTDDSYYQNQKQALKESYQLKLTKEKLPELSLDTQLLQSSILQFKCTQNVLIINKTSKKRPI